MHKPLSPMSFRSQLGLRFTETPPEGVETPPNPPAGGGTPPAEKTFTQAELNAIAAREKNEGKAAAERHIAEQLGVSVEEAKRIIADQKKASDAQKTEAERDRELAAKEKTDAENDRAAARKETHDARLERAFDKVGVDLSDAKEKDKNLRLLRLVTAEVGSSYDDILTEVKQIEKDFPGLFGGEGKTGRAPSGDPTGTPPKPGPGEEKFEAGRRRAQARLAGRGGGEKETNPLLIAANRR